jgi:hypothetical protein
LLNSIELFLHLLGRFTVHSCSQEDHNAGRDKSLNDLIKVKNPSGQLFPQDHHDTAFPPRTAFLVTFLENREKMIAGPKAANHSYPMPGK